MDLLNSYSTCFFIWYILDFTFICKKNKNRIQGNHDNSWTSGCTLWQSKYVVTAVLSYTPSANYILIWKFHQLHASFTCDDADDRKLLSNSLKQLWIDFIDQCPLLTNCSLKWLGIRTKPLISSGYNVEYGKAFTLSYNRRRSWSNHIWLSNLKCIKLYLKKQSDRQS